MRGVLAALALMFVVTDALAADVRVERVRFDSFDLDPSTGGVLTLDAVLYRPANAEGRRLPVVIALHGCGGLYSNVPARRDRLSLRHARMAEMLVGEGVAVLLPDSFRSRGREEICSLRAPQRVLNQYHRRLDAQAALAYLQSRPDVLPDRIALLGWSHGGVTLLAALNDADPEVRAFRASAPDMPYFRAGIAFYPGCVDALRSKNGYKPAVPLTMFIAGSDDWTAPGPCIRLAERLHAAGGPVQWTVYPDTFHGFDGPDSQRPVHLDYPNGVHPGQGVTVAVNAKARDDAYARVRELVRTLAASSASDP